MVLHPALGEYDQWHPSDNKSGSYFRLIPYAIVKRAEVWIHFQICREERPKPTRQAFERDVYIYVNDVLTLYRELQLKQANLQGPPKAAPYGILEFELTDLNGYRITFGQVS